jgi:rod shape determining protein RodA
MTPVNDRSSAWRAVNPALIGIVMMLVLFGSVMVRSALTGMEAADPMFRRHLLGLVIGTIGLGVAWFIDYRKLQGWAGTILVADAVLILLPLVPGLGGSAKGATLWLEVAGFRLFQPSEPAKLLYIVGLAALISGYKGSIDDWRDVARILGLAAIPFGLVVAVGDLGTGLVFAAITLAMLLIGGLKGRWFLVFALVAVLGVGVILKAGLLQEYQMNRLLVFVDPSRDPRGAGYNLEQSKIAIGSGELTGKGLNSGTQSRLNFLPERHTDFIFAVLGEETGFAGTALLLGLYLALLITALEISAQSRDLFGSLIVCGVIGMWTFQVLENIGMTIGVMPITGIPLPFMSYGSSFMVTNLVAVGMLLSVWTRRT